MSPRGVEDMVQLCPRVTVVPSAGARTSFKPTVTAAVYASPGPGLPDVAVIVMGRDLVFSQSVRSIEEGEKLLAHMLSGFAELAAKPVDG